MGERESHRAKPYPSFSVSPSNESSLETHLPRQTWKCPSVVLFRTPRYGLVRRRPISHRTGVRPPPKLGYPDTWSPHKPQGRRWAQLRCGPAPSADTHMVSGVRTLAWQSPPHTSSPWGLSGSLGPLGRLGKPPTRCPPGHAHPSQVLPLWATRLWTGCVLGCAERCEAQAS